MIEEKIKGFAASCKVTGFKDKSIETLSLRLNEFNGFLKSKRFKNIQSVAYSHLSAFVADYQSPSVHVKKARIWSLRQSFHFLTVDEFSRILHHCESHAKDIFGLRNLIIITMFGLLGRKCP